MSESELEKLIGFLSERERPEAPTVEEIRAGFEALAQSLDMPDDASIGRHNIDGLAAEMITAPGAGEYKTLLYLHGGGYVIGSINTHRNLAYDISAASGMRVLLIDYRLAPEAPFPAAVEDATKAYQWLLGRGVSNDDIAIGGDSAGGGLTIATMEALKNYHIALPACAVCLSPWVDLEMNSESIRSRADMDPIVDEDTLTNFAKLYLNGANPREALASPIYGNLSNFPEILIQVGTSEVLYDDALQLHGAIRSAGSHSRLEVWQDMIHVWQMFAPMLSEGRDAIQHVGNFLREKVND